MRKVVAFGVLLLLTAQPWAGEPSGIRHLAVENEKGVYRVRFEAVVKIEPDRAFAMLTNYERLDRLNPGIVEAERLDTDDSQMRRVRTVVEGCVLFFCRRLERVETIRTNHRRRIVTRVVPEASDFRSGEGRWELAAVTEGTRLRFRGSLAPDFWVPPVIGPWAIERNLRATMRTMVERLERYGRSREAP